MGIITKEFRNLGEKKPYLFNRMNLLSNKNTSVFDMKKLWAFSCMNVRANELAYCDFNFFKGEEELTNLEHWGNKLKESPNQNYTWFDLWYMVSMWLDLKGNCYILPNKVSIGGATFPTSFMVIPANRVRENTEGLTIKSYDITLGKLRARIDAEDMIHIKDMSPSAIDKENFYLGQADIFNAIKDVQEIVLKRLDFIESYFTSDGVMPFVFSSNNQELGQDEASEILKAYNQGIKNPKYIAQAFLPNGTDVRPLGSPNSSESAISSWTVEQERLAIASAFNVPETILTHKYNSRAAAQDTIQFFNEKNTDPRAEKIAQYINQYLGRFTDVRIKYVPRPFKNEEFELRKTATLFQYNAISRDEFREANGYEPEGMVLLGTEKKTLI